MIFMLLYAMCSVVEKGAKASVTFANFACEHVVVNNTGKKVLMKVDYP